MSDFDDLLAAQPSWKSDGLGLRGNPIMVPPSFGETVERSNYTASSVDRPSDPAPLGSDPVLFSSNPPQPYPWIGQTTVDEDYYAWFGVGNSSFVTDGAAPIAGLQINVSGSNSGSEMALTVGDDGGNDALTLYNATNYVKVEWLAEAMITLSHANDSASACFQTESLIFTDADNSHASGLHAQYLDFDNSKVFLGFSDEQGYQLVLNADNHAAGFHPTHLDFDGSRVFLGHDKSDNQYKLTLNDGTLGAGLNTGYLELASQHVFLGYSSSEQTTHLTISPDSAYVSLGTSGQAFFGNGQGTWHLELQPSDSYIQIGDCFMGHGSDGTDHIELPSNSYIQVGDCFMGAGSDSTNHIELPNNAYLNIGDGSVWLGYGDGGYHLELPSDGWITLGTTNINDGQISFSQGEDGLKIYDDGWSIGDGPNANAYGIYYGQTTISDGDISLGELELYGSGWNIGDGANANSSGFYVGSASLVSDSCTVGYGFYCGSSSLTSDGITINGTTFSAVAATWCDGNGNSVSGNILAAAS